MPGPSTNGDLGRARRAHCLIRKSKWPERALLHFSRANGVWATFLRHDPLLLP